MQEKKSVVEQDRGFQLGIKEMSPSNIGGNQFEINTGFSALNTIIKETSQMQVIHAQNIHDVHSNSKLRPQDRPRRIGFLLPHRPCPHSPLNLAPYSHPTHYLLQHQW
jgi:hypothetical protein